MKQIRPDDFEVGSLVTIVSGPFVPLPAMPFASADDPPTQEDTSLHGRVFTLAAYDAPFVILVPLEGVKRAPPMPQGFPWALMGGAPSTPSPVRLNSGGVALALVSDDYVEAYKKFFCGGGQPSRKPAYRKGTARRLLKRDGDEEDDAAAAGSPADPV